MQRIYRELRWPGREQPRGMTFAQEEVSMQSTLTGTCVSVTLRQFRFVFERMVLNASAGKLQRCGGTLGYYTSLTFGTESMPTYSGLTLPVARNYQQ